MSRTQGCLPLVTLLVALISAVSPISAQAPPQHKAEQTTMLVYAPLQYIKLGSVLAITVADEPDLTHEYRVSPDGQIQLTIAGTDSAPGHTWSLPVVGKTADQARAAVTASLQTYLRDPQVQVRIVTAPRITVEVRGAADKTGIVSLAADTTVSEALAACKYHPDADLAHVIVMHKPPAPPTAGPDHPAPPPASIRVDFQAFLHGDSDVDPPLANGDILVVPASIDAHPAVLQIVRVTGEVNTEAAIPWSAGLHVKEAFERAGGLKATADREHIRLIRGIDGKIVIIDWSKPGADQTVFNTELGPGDLIIVTARDRSQAYAVVGEVVYQRKNDYPTGAHIMLSEALHEAGGITKNADPHHGLLRRGYLMDPATAHDIPFDPERVLYHQVADVELQPGDVVAVMPKQKRPGFWQQFVPLLFRFLPL